MALTTAERMIRVETQLTEVCKDLTELKSGQVEVLKELRDLDNKFATKAELSNVRKSIYFIGGILASFALWTIQQYLTNLGG